MSNVSNIAGSHASRAMFMRSVRDALVTSVTCRPPSGPPVRFQVSQESMVPAHRSPASARFRSPSTWSRSHATFGPVK